MFRRRKSETGTPLAGVDVVLADLDGVVYRGETPVPYAVDSLNAAAASARLGYITNNASRTDASVAAHLSELGLSVRPEDVVTSPQAAVRLLSQRIDAGSTVFVVGGDGLVDELTKGGFSVTRSADDGPVALVQGFSPDVTWKHLAEASYALAEGIPWIATNMDWTLPTTRGLAPGNGTLVSAVHSAAGRLPDVAGKPEGPIFAEAVDRFEARNPLFIGDRLETDVRGAVGADIASVFVLTGVDHAKQLLAAPEGSRPDYILEDLRQLHEPYPELQLSKDGTTATVAGAKVRVNGITVEIVEDGDREIDLLRAACAAIWNCPHSIHVLDVPERLYTEPVIA